MDSESTKPGTAKEAGGTNRGRGLVEAGLLYIGVPAVTLYPLGFLGLGIQLWKDPFFPYQDFTTIWQAVALVEERVVIATGVRLIYLSLVATVLGMGIATLLLNLLGRAPAASDRGLSEARRRRKRGLQSLFWIVLLPTGAFLAWHSGHPNSWGDLWYLRLYPKTARLSKMWAQAS